MNPFASFTTPGVHVLPVDGLVGNLEVELTIPETANWERMAIIGHPHSLQGGTMNNKVVTTMVRAYKAIQIPTIRFNFRGVGQSAGEYDAGIGESEDMLLLARWWKESHPTAIIEFAGFSFGSFVAYRAACLYQQSVELKTALITIAPSVDHYSYQEFPLHQVPWVVIQGDEDEIVAAKSVHDFTQKFHPPLPLFTFKQTGHFFHGKLIELKDCLMNVIKSGSGSVDNSYF